jgi:flagellar hook protein FlgE
VASINDGLFAGRAGIQSHGSAISVIADNIANSNTTGYKASRPDFVDLLAGNLSGSSSTAVGSGSALNSVTQIFNQGTFEFTGRGLDLGIDGNGFFVVQDLGGTGQRFYTRAGNMSVDRDGNLLNQNGYAVLGFPEGGTGGLEALNVNQISQSSVATSLVSIAGNLNASSDQLAAGTNPAVDYTTFADLNANADFSTFVDVFDSLGNPHAVTVSYFHLQTGVGLGGTWQAVAYVDGSDIDGGTAGVPEVLGETTINFTTSGVVSGGTPTATLTGAWANGTSSSISVEFEPYTQFATASNVSKISQDGTGGGSVVSFSVDPSGLVFAQLDNGRTAAIGSIGLATFGNIEGMRRVGSSLYAETTRSGEPVIGTPGTGIFGGIQGGALELSTSDLASDFVKLISLQRGFQGSSRVIGNINELLNEVINLA